jgi:hypothetical protein
MVNKYLSFFLLLIFRKGALEKIFVSRYPPLLVRWYIVDVDGFAHCQILDKVVLDIKVFHRSVLVLGQEVYTRLVVFEHYGGTLVGDVHVPEEIPEPYKLSSGKF